MPSASSSVARLESGLIQRSTPTGSAPPSAISRGTSGTLSTVLGQARVLPISEHPRYRAVTLSEGTKPLLALFDQRLPSRRETPAAPSSQRANLEADLVMVADALRHQEADPSVLAALARIAEYVRRSLTAAAAVAEISAVELAEIPQYPGRGTDSLEWYEEHWAPLVRAGRVWQHHVREADLRLFRALARRCERSGRGVWELFPAKPGKSGPSRSQ